MDYAVSIMVKPSRGDITKALQETVAEMRIDIQTFFFWERIKPEEVKHLYARIASIKDEE
jgi:chloramphenicol 3-O-phosphotransferase